MAMADPNYAPIGDDANDDLPRTFRREKEARAREARERAAQERATAPPTLSSGAPAQQAHYADAAAGLSPQAAPVGAYGDANMIDMPYPASVRRFDVPFFHLVGFFLKAVVAAIPALILLGIILWFGGQLFESLFPDLLKMKILISFPN